MPLTHLTVPAADGLADAVLATPPAGTGPGVLVFMDAFGLRPRLEQMAERLAAAGYVVLVPDLFYRTSSGPLVEDIAAAMQDREKLFAELGRHRAPLTPERTAADTTAWLAVLAERAPGPVATVGYCMGGALALTAAQDHPGTVTAVASFHGGRLATDEPGSPHLRLADARAELYFAHADHDHSMPAEAIERLDAALATTGLPATSEVYAGAQHGFTMSDTPSWDAAAEQRHWDALLALLERRLS